MERKNFIKCCKLIVKYCKGVMFEIVERSIDPCLHELALDQLCEIYKRVNEREPELPTTIREIFQDIKDMPPVESDFDVSSLYFMIKFFCKNVDPPTNGWGSEVGEEHLSIGDDIERVQLIRNDILKKFGKNAEIPDGEFNDMCERMKGLVKRLENQYGGKKYQDTLERINADDMKEVTANERKESKTILKEFLKSCETAVDMGDKRLCKEDIDQANECRKAAGLDTDEIIRQQEIALRQLKDLVEQLKVHIGRANKRIDDLEEENKKLKEENEELKKKKKDKTL